MRALGLLLLPLLAGACASQATRNAREFVRWDARSDAWNSADYTCGGVSELIAGGKGFSPDDYRCLAATDLTVVREIIDPTELARRAASFEKSMNDSGHAGRVLGCRSLVDVSEGRAGVNHSYGGICTVESGAAKRDYLMCDDQMVGHFALTSTFVDDRQAEVQFVKKNCVGG